MAIERTTWVVTVGVIVAGFAAQADFTAVGTYDEQVYQTNVVDSVAAAQAGDEAFVIEAGEYAAYVADVAARFSVGRGGVLGLNENRYGEVADGLPLNVSYASGAKILTLTPSAADLLLTNNQTAQTSISGGPGAANAADGLPGGAFYTGAGTSFALDVTSITGGALGEYVDSLGITMLSRAARVHPGTTAVATFSDLSTATATSDIDAINAGDDTFFGFVAPAGESITGVTISWTSNLVALDDVSFTTIPEPGVLALLGVGLGLVAMRRKRR